MMRKLAVTVFALSLAALGCGSDSGTKTPDSATASPDGGKTPDAYVAPVVDTGAADAPAGPEVQVQLDTQKVVDTQVPDAPMDQAPALDTGSLDGIQGIDVSKPQLDSGVDAPKADTGPAVDAGSVDGGTVG